MTKELEEQGYKLVNDLSDAEMVAIIDMCNKGHCPFARVGECDPNGEGKCKFTELKEYIWEVIK